MKGFLAYRVADKPATKRKTGFFVRACVCVDIKMRVLFSARSFARFFRRPLSGNERKGETERERERERRYRGSPARHVLHSPGRFEPVAPGLPVKGSALNVSSSGEDGWPVTSPLF